MKVDRGIEGGTTASRPKGPMGVDGLLQADLNEMATAARTVEDRPFRSATGPNDQEIPGSDCFRKPGAVGYVLDGRISDREAAIPPA
jgi:hypothetical protein